MTIRILIIIIILMNISEMFCQTACDCSERLQNRADYYFMKQDYKLALKYFKMSKKFTPISAYTTNSDLTYAKYLIANDELDSASFYLRRAYINGVSSIEDNYDFKKFVESNYYQEIKAIKRKLPDNFNWEFYEGIIKARALDQTIRRYGELKDVFKDGKRAYEIVDSINFSNIRQLISKFGLPSFQTTGFDFNQINLFLLHSSVYSSEDFEIIKSILESAIEKGLFTKGSLANIVDRRRDWVEHLPQLYGAWNFPHRFKEIENIETIDSIRFTMNLLTLKDYAFMSGKEELPKGYTEAPYPENYFCEDKW